MGNSKSGWATRRHPRATHRYSETFARGGVGQAGVETRPFRADRFMEMRGSDRMREETIARSNSRIGHGFQLRAARWMPIDRWCCRRCRLQQETERGQASYYFSQPYFKAAGSITIDDKPHEVTGWPGWIGSGAASRSLRSNRMGLALAASDLRREAHVVSAASKRWPQRSLRQLDRAGRRSTEISSADNSMTPTAFTELEGRRIPTRGALRSSRSLTIECVPLNPRS